MFHEPLVSRSSGGVVLVRDIDFAATCDATLMPFHGQCHVAYMPTDSSILGLSKLARLVNAFSKRLCSPNGLCHDLTKAIASCTPCHGVYVQVSAKHLASAATQQRVFAESYTGVFDQPHSTQLKVLPHSVCACYHHPPELNPPSMINRSLPMLREFVLSRT